MYTIIVQSLNQYCEVELEKSFRAKTKAAASMMATKWCNAGWGNEWKQVCNKRVNSLNPAIIIWELGWK